MITENFASLGRQQVGRIAEYLARIAFTQRGYTVFTPDVDDSGVDLLIYRADVGYTRIQVKSLRRNGYVFMRKRYFQPATDLALCLILFSTGEPEILLIPSLRWERPCPVFVARDYEGLKSEPEFGVNVSAKAMPELREYVLA